MWQVVIIGLIIVCAGLYLAGTVLKKWRAYREGRPACCACENRTSTLQNHSNFSASENSGRENSENSKQES